jgi:hypothetical protein
MNFKAAHLRGAGDTAGANEVERLVRVLRARADDDIAADRKVLDRRVAEVSRQLDEIAEQAR